MARSFPKIYPILDSSIIPAIRRKEFLRRLGESLLGADVAMLEYRNKTGSEDEVKSDAEVLRSALPVGKVKLILDDRADLVEAVGFDGVHVDAGDVSPVEARRLLGPDRIVGTFGGGDALVADILSAPVDYLSVGPVFATRTKQTTKGPIGIEGVRRLRGAAGPGPVLVGVAGITLDTAAGVLNAGADVIAVAEALFGHADPAAEYLKWVAALN
jgi:thiamine-phosphate pyrophosphorylase